MTSTFLSEKEFEDIFKSHIKIETYSESIESLFCSLRNLERIDYKPYYQRNYVWDDSKASYFIESILLGTEIPPLIFFNEGRKTEVIDGRQRFETIKRFIDGDFNLSRKGLLSLTDLSKKNLESLRQESLSVYETFLDAKIRIIEFELVNQPPSSPILLDKVKKEIFARYNSGITPLKRAEIDNAIYDSDNVSIFFKKNFKSNQNHKELISDLFLRQSNTIGTQRIETVLQFIRKSLVLYKIAIKYYAGKSRTELIKKFYEYSFTDHNDPQAIYDNLIAKIETIKTISDKLVDLQIKPNLLFWESLLWAIHIIEGENKDYSSLLQENNINKVSKFWKAKESIFKTTDSHYYSETINRFSTIGELVNEIFNINFDIYISGGSE